MRMKVKGRELRRKSGDREMRKKVEYSEWIKIVGDCELKMKLGDRELRKKVRYRGLIKKVEDNALIESGR